MRILTNIIYFFIVIAIATTLYRYGNGHVVVFFGDYRMDTALSSFLLMLTVLFIILYFIIRLTSNIYHLPHQFHQWKMNYKTSKSRKIFNQGLVKYLKGKLDKSYDDMLLLSKTDQSKDNQCIALLLALKISLELQDKQKENDVMTKLQRVCDDKWQKIVNTISIPTTNK